MLKEYKVKYLDGTSDFECQLMTLMVLKLFWKFINKKCSLLKTEIVTVSLNRQKRQTSKLFHKPNLFI